MSATSKDEHQCVANASSPSHAFPHSLLLDTTEASAKTSSAADPPEAACGGGASRRRGGDVTLWWGEAARASLFVPPSLKAAIKESAASGDACVAVASFVARVLFLWPAAWGPSQSPAAEEDSPAAEDVSASTQPPRYPITMPCGSCIGFSVPFHFLPFRGRWLGCLAGGGPGCCGATFKGAAPSFETQTPSAFSVAGGAAGAEEALAALLGIVVASQHLFAQWQ